MKKLITMSLMLTAFCGVSMADDIHRVVGSSSVLGSEWNLTDDNNKMTSVGNGLYTLTKNGISLNAGDSFIYKVCTNGNWNDGNYGANGQDDAYYKVSKTGLYDVTFVFKEGGYNGLYGYVGCIVKGDDMKLIYSTDNGTTWNVSSNTVSYSSGAYSVEIEGSVGMLFALAPAADAADGISGDEVRRFIRPTTSGDYWAFIQHSSDDAVPINTGKAFYIAEAGTYTFTYYVDSNSFGIDAVATGNMGTAGWRTYSTGTYSGSNGYTVSGTDVTAYYVSYDSGSTATLNTIADGAVIPTMAGVLLQGSGTFTVSSSSTTPATPNNLFRGSGSNELNMSEISNAYIFADGANGLGFYKLDKGQGATLGANKAYLDGSTISFARSFIGFGDNDVDGISEVNALTEGSIIYSLQGVRTNRLHKGLNIIGSKKVLVK